MNAIIIAAVWGVVMMFGGVLFKKSSTAKYWAVAGILVLLAANLLEFFGTPLFDINYRGMLHFDEFGLQFNTVSFAAVLLYFLLNGDEIEKVGSHVSEYYALIFFILCGLSIVSSFNTLLMMFLGIEIMSIPAYILTASDKQNLKSNEAGLKYFLMGAFSTGLMLMGIALVYGGNPLGSFYINVIDLGSGHLNAMIGTGLVLLLVSLAFKVSAAPFHFWAADVYDGAPTVFTAFMATIVKIAGFVAFIRLFEVSFGIIQREWQMLIVVIIAATLIIGNLTAVFQQSVKRMLAYSSIAHAGFMMFALFALNNTAREGLILYALAYSVATIGIFAVLVKMDDYTIEGFNGLYKYQPVLALTATIFLLSLTGIPLTAGFAAKFYMLLAAVKTGHQFWLVILAVICAAISAVYYFRVIQAMYFKEPSQSDPPRMDVNGRFKFLLIAAAAVIIVFGMLPSLVIDWIYY
ncbi:MAG: NADH-quinone oxidoreductase subunit N [Bacteroidota bacterium]|nr:NADH-quinone oxidoreductase subunit N [Bacteroidota bacterium]